MKTVRIIFLLALVALASCKKEDPLFKGLDKVNYTSSDENFPNPERGFYSPVYVHSASARTISQVALDSNRKMGYSLFLLEFHLTDYVNTDIADEYLQLIRNDFAALRSSGAKCILRFAYSDGRTEEDKPWDATEEWVMRHIAQLKPLLQENYDVIMVLQAGFIGSWGEWYYTENFGARSKEDYAARKRVVDALLDALPESRQISLRIPAYKMNMYGYSATDTLTRAEAHKTTPKARLGGHNDCYLADANDTGTFTGQSTKDYWAAESAYTIMGGETCGTSAYAHCEKFKGYDGAHGVVADMAIYHYTYLNIGYHPTVIQWWKKEGCFEQLQRRLGYRYSLVSAGFTEKPKAGSDMRVVMKIRNEGFSPAQNPRDAELVLTGANGKVLESWPLESDPRYWMPGTTVVDQTITLPTGISGEVQLHLNLPDPCATLHEDPRYSIRLANTNVWDENTGYNLLKSFKL